MRIEAAGQGGPIELHTSTACRHVGVGYALPAQSLRSYVSTYSLTVVEPGSALVYDQVYPEWANVRLTADGNMTACTGPGALVRCNPSAGIGPTSHATHFSLGPGHYWTIGLLPLGWARFFDQPASSFADRWEIIGAASAFSPFARLVALVADSADPDAAVARIDAHICGLLSRPAIDEDMILRTHKALIDPEVTTVAHLADRAGLTIRSLERLASRAFGFMPKLLLRRQRFLRRLSQFMLDPSLAWIETMDTQYVDQAHFIRDFKRFMDTTPSAYAARPHPVLWAAARAREAVAGKAMQVLQPPA